MDFVERCVTMVIKDMLDQGFITAIKNGTEYMLNAGFHTLADMAVKLCKHLLYKKFNCFSFQEETSHENSIYELIIKTLKKMVKYNYETIKMFLKAVIDFLKSLFKQTFTKTSETGAAVIKKGNEFTENFAKLTVGWTAPPSHLFPANRIATDEDRRKISSKNETNIISRKIDFVQKRNITIYNRNTKTIPNACNEITNVIIGTRKVENTKFKGVEIKEKKYWLYVGRVNKESSEKDIIDYLTKNIPNGNFTCNKLTSKGSTQSFKVSVNLSLKNTVEDPQFWPIGVMVRPFKFKQKTDNRQLKDSVTQKIMIREVSFAG